jgi:hypothetical protein
MAYSIPIIGQSTATGTINTIIGGQSTATGTINTIIGGQSTATGTVNTITLGNNGSTIPYLSRSDIRLEGSKVYINGILIIDIEEYSNMKGYIKDLQSQIMILSDFIKMMMISNSSLPPDYDKDLITPIDL